MLESLKQALFPAVISAPEGRHPDRAGRSRRHLLQRPAPAADPQRLQQDAPASRQGADFHGEPGQGAVNRSPDWQAASLIDKSLAFSAP